MITTANQQQFSIYNDMISTEHREFYERIINDLLAIKPICNQGKSTAAEISETATEQEQITDLMERVERFAEELHNGTKNLFDQFYLAKEDFCRSIYCTTAFIKVNLTVESQESDNTVASIFRDIVCTRASILARG